MKFFIAVLIALVAALAIYKASGGHLGLRRLEHVVRAAVERHTSSETPVELTRASAPESKPDRKEFCPDEDSVTFARYAQPIWFNPTLSGGAHTWVFNGAEVIRALSAYCGQTILNSGLLAQIRNLLIPTKMPTATGGYQDQKQLGAAFMFLLARRTPAVWNELSEQEHTLIDIMMEAFMYSSVFTTKDGVAGSLGMNGDTNLNRDWNPNYQNGMVGMIIITALYWGFDDFEAKLATYDDAAFIKTLREKKLLNLLATYANPVRPSGDVVQAGLRKAVNGSVYRFHGISERDILGLFNYIARRTFSATISCGLNDGAGISGAAKIAQNCSRLPNIGQPGMLLEFDSWDAEGKRSSADYTWGAWYVLNYSRAALQIEGWLTPAVVRQSTTLDETLRRYYLGSVDLWFKLSPEKGGGYLDYDHGKPAGKTVADRGFIAKFGALANLDLFNILQRNLGMATIEK